jgi:sialidase-1
MEGLKMAKKEFNSRNPYKNDLILSLLQLLFSLLFCAIYIVFMTSFQGEFLIIVKGLWILPIFILFLLAGSIYSTVMAIRSRRTQEFKGILSDRIKNPSLRRIWLLCWALWNLIASLPILLIGKVLALGALGSVPNFLIALLTLPFLGYAILFVISSLKLFLDLIQRREDLRLMRGIVLSGFAFLFTFSSFGILSAFWNPQWTEGVEPISVFTPGEEVGRGYRIPAMIALPGDIMLAFSESRINAMSDLLDIHIVMKRSLDGGNTWSPIQIIEDVGNQTVHSPCPVYDQQTQTVWLPFCINYEILYITSSTDTGLTWSEPRNLSQELELPEGTWCHNGPGNGVQISTGRLLIPTSLGDARVIYSDDHGLTWEIGEPIGKGGEPQIFERVDGTVCANLRSTRGGYRIQACSSDGGETWDPWSYNEDLPAAGTQASILRFTTEADGDRNRLLFSNPGAPYRGEFTIRMSYDEGVTWPVSKLVYQGAAGYSSLAVLSDHSILALFETGKYDLRESITLIKINMDWLTDGNDKLGSSQ